MMGLMRRLRSDDGYTLAEVLVVAVLVPVVLGIAFMLWQMVNGIVEQTEATDIANTRGRIAMDRIGRELRQAQEVVQGDGAFAAAQPRLCIFYADVDGDGIPERITYRVVGQELRRTQAHATNAVPPYTWGSDAPEQVVLPSLKGGWTGNVFDYFDTEDPPQAVPPGQSKDVSAVSVHLISAGAAGHTQSFVDFSTWIRIRAVNNGID